jgi:toxin ParE1/3/4
VLQVDKTDGFLLRLEDIVLHIAQDNTMAAIDLETRIHQQVDSLADPNFPRRKGRLPGTFELVAHANYLVIFQQSKTTVKVLSVLHVARKTP